MKPLETCLLYTFIDSAYLHGRDPVAIAEQLCEGGSDLIQIRAKGCSREEIRRIGARVAPVLERAGVGLVINDYPQLAVDLGAPFCHLGQEDFLGYSNVSEVRGSGGLLRIGLSSHRPEQAQTAIAAGAAYIAIGPVYATPTKPTAAAVSLEYVRWAAQHVHIPWFAIGGIDPSRLDAVLEAGARRICVVSAILNAPNISKACQAFKDRLISADRR
jgi:thiamine-phosphate pyrophosphorylase